MKDYGIFFCHLVEKSTVCFLYDQHLIHVPKYSFSLSAITQIHRLAEQKGYIVTTEIDQENYAIIPNLRIAFFCPILELFCWCHYDR
jgi:hypothetical protein